MGEESKTRLGEVRTVSIPASDVERARRFYVERLGFEVRLDAACGQGQRWLEAAPPGATRSSPQAARCLMRRVRVTYCETGRPRRSVSCRSPCSIVTVWATSSTPRTSIWPQSVVKLWPISSAA